MPDHIRHVLTIEFEYVRVYINSLALQAVIERCTNTTSDREFAAPRARERNAKARDRFDNVAFSRLMGLQDQDYIREVVDASRNLLKTVVAELLPGDYLKHCPVRTYLYVSCHSSERPLIGDI